MLFAEIPRNRNEPANAQGEIQVTWASTTEPFALTIHMCVYILVSGEERCVTTLKTAV